MPGLVDPRAHTSVAIAALGAVIGWETAGAAVGVASGLGVLLLALLLNGMITWRSSQPTSLLAALSGVQKWVGVMHQLALQLVELLVVMGIAIWTSIGAISYLRTTGGTLGGLLTLLDSKWKGVLILSGILLLRSIHEVLARTRRFSVPWLEQVPQEPSDEPTVVEGPTSKQERRP